ncbi:MAG: tetratricopeptide repeat protein [Elusimicrobia bacterium]|nr:tetratricopeptide repeat protein [Elusimicrobiota bacterium]
MPGLLPALGGAAATVLRDKAHPGIWPGLALFVLTGLCFAGILRNGFVWDDWPFVPGTMGFRGLDFQHLRWMATTARMSTFAPLAWLSYAVDYSAWGLDPFGYHLTNLLLHATNAVLFFGLARLLLRRLFPQEDGAALGAGAALAALVFSIHPLRVESVSWVSERRDLLAGAFFLATLQLYLRAQAREPGRRWGLMSASIACFALAALSKPSVVPLPIVLLILDYYPLQRLRMPARPAAAAGVLAEKIPYLLIASAAAFMAIRAQVITQNFVAMDQYGLPSRLAQSLYGLGFYLEKTLAPLRLCPLYPLPERMSLMDPMVWRSLLVLAAGAWALGRCGVVGKAAAALWAYYLAMLLPVLGPLQNGPQLVAMRYSYLACLGWALLAGAAVVQAGRAWEGRRRWSRWSYAVAALILGAAVNAGLVQAHIRVCQDDVSLWAAVLAQYPDSFNANLNMADGLIRSGDPRSAVAYARQALLRSGADDGMATLCLAKALAGAGFLPESRLRLERLVRKRPDWSAAHDLLGVVLAGQGETNQALERFRRAVALDPHSAQARGNLGSLLARQGRFAQALPFLEAAARLAPDDPRARAVLEQARLDSRLSQP